MATNSKIRKVLLIGALMSISLFVNSQSDFSKDIEFINYLCENNELNNALHLIRKVKPDTTNRSQVDSLNYYKGWIFHMSKKVDSAIFYFEMIPNQSALSARSAFYKSLNYLYAKNSQASLNVMNMQTDTAQIPSQLKLLNVAGICLIDRNLKTFDSITKQFDFSNHVYSEEQTYLLDIQKQIKKVKRKSPLVAGLLSAAVPGLGKYYAGKKGSSIATAATTLIFGALVFESWYRSGYKSPQTIVFGSLFTIFYMGNILGSAYSVKIQKRNYNNKINNEIIATLHIPIKRFFN